MTERKKETLYLSIDARLIEQLYAYARTENLQVPDVVEELFSEFLKDKVIDDPLTKGDYIGVAEVMDILGCSKQTVYNLFDKGKLDGIQRARWYYFTRESVLAYRENNAMKGGNGCGRRKK